MLKGKQGIIQTLLWISIGLLLYQCIPGFNLHQKLLVLGVPAISDPFFADIQAVLGGIECYKAGFNPYNPDACLDFGARWAYTPTWFLLSNLPITRTWALWIGIFHILAILFVLAYLSNTIPIKRWAWIVLFLFSPAILFAIERGNADILMLLLLVVAVLHKASRPLLALAGIAIAASLKVYPIVALIIFIPDLAYKPLRYYIIGTALAFLAFVGFYSTEFQAIQALAPKFVGISFGWGVFQLHAQEMGYFMLSKLIFWGFIGACLGIIYSEWRNTKSYKLNTTTEQQLYLTGAVLYVFNYIMGYQVDYRMVLLLMLLPKLLSDPRGMKIKHLTVLILLLMVCWGNFASMWLNYKQYNTLFSLGVYQPHPIVTYVEESAHFILTLLLFKDLIRFCKTAFQHLLSNTAG